MQRNENRMELRFSALPENEAFARLTVSAFVLPLDPGLEELEDLKTAVSEAVTNAIVHAYPDTLGKVTMVMKLFEDNTVEVTVKDKGVGIADLTQARTPLFTTGGAERAGMGFTIMESFTDGMKVRSAPGKGTAVVLSKRIARRLGGPR